LSTALAAAEVGGDRRCSLVGRRVACRQWRVGGGRAAAAAAGCASRAHDGAGHLYNHTRPHRALGRRTPAEAFNARIKAWPTKPATPPASQLRLRRDTVDLDGKLTIRYAGQIRHLGVGRRFAGTTQSTTVLFGVSYATPLRW